MKKAASIPNAHFDFVIHQMDRLKGVFQLLSDPANIAFCHPREKKSRISKMNKVRTPKHGEAKRTAAPN